MTLRIVVVLVFIAFTQAAYAVDTTSGYVASSTLKVPDRLTQPTTKPAHSVDTLVKVMQRMKPESAVKIAYQEIRYLELMQEPWQATGFMYALAPDLLVKEQQTPALEIMGASGDKMYYYDPVNNVRHSGEMANDDPLSLNVAAFKALVTGDRQLLEKMYRIAFSANPEQWTLTLTDYEDNDASIKIIITGPAGRQANKIAVHQADGDHSEFILTEAARGDHLNDTIRQLNQQLLGE